VEVRNARPSIRRRFNPRVGVAMLVVVGLAFAVASTGSAAPAPAAPGFVGIVAQDVFAGGLKYEDKQVPAMRKAGITLIRQVFDWSIVERKRGKFNFSVYDSAVLAAAKRGIEIMPILFNPPSFLSARPRHNRTHGTYPPKSLSSIAAFAQAAERWFGPNGRFWAAHKSVKPVPIRIWQVWDEPNLTVYWLPKPNAVQYVSLLKSASQAIHALDPGAEVVSGGLPLSNLPGINLYTYLKQLLAAGGAQWINTLGVNAYSPTAAGMIDILDQVRSTLNAGGASKVALRVTEFGWSDAGPPDQFKLGPTGQATQITDAIHDFAADSSSLDLRGFVYYDWRDAKPYEGAPDFWGLHTGLLKLNGKPKPALQAFSAAANAL
jgi:hypothetical protein